MRAIDFCVAPSLSLSLLTQASCTTAFDVAAITLLVRRCVFAFLQPGGVHMVTAAPLNTFTFAFKDTEITS